MAIHIDIYAHLVKAKMIKEGDDLKRYVDNLEKDLNVRIKKGAQGRSKEIIKASDAQRGALQKLRRQSVDTANTIASVGKQLEANSKALDANTAKLEKNDKVKRRTEATDRRRAKLLEERAALEKESAELTERAARAMEAFDQATNSHSRSLKDLNDTTSAHTKNLRKVNRLVKDNKKDFASLTRVTNQQRRELESLHGANQSVLKDNTVFIKQMDRVSDATKKTTAERAKYNEMLKEGNASYKQLRDQSERVRAAHQAEQRVIRDTTASLGDLIQGRQQHDVVVNANEHSLRKLSRAAIENRNQAEGLRRTNLNVVRDSAAMTRMFDNIGEATQKAFREHQKYNRMASDGSTSQEALRQQLERTNDAYANQARQVHNASEALRRHHAAEREQQRRQALSGRKHQGIDIGRWAARNLGALTPLGTVTPTLVLPLGTAFIQVANGAVAASQSIALLPAVLTAGAAAFGTLKMATNGFGDTIGALMDGDMKKFAEEINKLSPSAQQAALTFQHLLPEIQGIQQAAQEAFFSGAPQLGFQLFQTLGPTIKSLTTDIATSMNQSMKGVGNLLMTPDNLRSIDLIAANIAQTFRILAPAVSDVAQAFLDLTRQGSIMLPGMAEDVADLAANFRKFIGDARESGALKDFMRQGWEALKAVGAAVLDFGKMLYDVFGLKSQEDIARFKETMQEMTNLMEVVLRTLKKLFEDIAAVFTSLSDFVKLFGIDLDGTSSILATLAEAWLFVHGVKRLKDLATAARDFKVALQGAMAAQAGASALGAVTSGGAAAAAGGGAAAASGGIAARLLGTLGGLAGPVAAATAAIVGLGAAAIWATHKLSDVGKDLPPGAAPTKDALATGAIPGSTPTSAPGLKPPELSNNDKAKLKYMGLMDTQGKFTAPLEKIYQALGRPIPKPAEAPQPGAWSRPGSMGNAPAPGFGSSLKDLGGAFGNVPGAGSPWPGPFGVPGIPTDAADFQSTPGTFELSKIPIGQFGGANWDVPHGVMDVPRILKPGDTGFGKPGQWNVDPWEVTQAQWKLDDAQQRVEEQRKAYLATQADNNRTQDDINKAAHNVIEAERGWMEAMRGLKEAERGEFDAFSKQTRTFADDLKDALGDLGAALDPDFGVSKGLAGIAENLIKFTATLAAAPVLGAMKGYQAGLGFPGGKGVGSGLIGIEAAKRGYYQRDDEAAAMWQAYASGQYPGMTGLQGSYGPGPGNFGDRAPYGLPPGTNTGGYGSSGKVFPPWVDAIEDIFGIKASTYKGHQESDRNEPGYAPNPNRENRGIDWTGPTENLQKFAEYLERIPQALEQVIWQNPNTGRKTGIGGGQINPGYYPQSTYDVHGGNDPGNIHVHTRQSASIPLPQQGVPQGYGAQQQQQQQVPYGSPYYQVPQAQQYGPVPGVFDDGGVLPPGPSIVVNNTGKPEPLVNPLNYGLNIPQAPAKQAPAPKPISPGDLTNPGLTDPVPGVKQPTPPSIENTPPPGAVPTVAPVAGAPAPTLVPGGAVTPLGVPTTGSTIGSKVEPYAGYGSGLKVGGGLIGAALSGAASAAGAAGGGGPAAAAAMQIGIQEIQRAIEFAGQVGGIAVQGVMDTFLPTGGSKLAQENWITRIAGGIMGAMPALPNLAGNGGQLGQGANLPGVGPATPEQIAAQGMDPNRTQHTGTQPAPGPYTGVNIEQYNVQATEDRAGQDIARYQFPGTR